MTQEPTAQEAFHLRLKVGRFLPGPLLAVAVFLRELPAMLIDGFGTGLVAPSWIVITDRRDGRRVARLSTGREPGAGEALFEQMSREAASMPASAFLQRWTQSDEAG